MREEFSNRAATTDRSREITPFRATAVLLEAVLDHFTVGTIVLDAQGRIMHMNDAATQIASLHDGIEVKRHSIALKDTDEDASLNTMIQRATLSKKRSRVCQGMVSVTRPSGSPDYHVCVAPLGADGQCVALFLFDPDGGSAVSSDVLMHALGVSRAEARIAKELAAGARVAVIAERLSISVHTVRTHVKAILLKTGSKSQRDLAMRLAPFTALRFEDR